MIYRPATGMQLTNRRSLRAFVLTMVLLAALALGNSPYLYGMAIRPAGTRFWAVPPVNSSDANQYLAFARQVSQGQLLLGDPFTAEPHTPRLFLPHALFDGALCRLLGGNPLAAFQVSRIVAGLALLAAGLWFGFLLLPHWRRRRLYLGLLCFAGGLGGWVDRLAPGVAHGDALQPEGNTFFLLGNLPHLALSAALLTALFGTLLALERDGKRRWLGITLVLAFLLAWIHPFDFVTLGLALSTYAVLRWIDRGELPRASLAHAGALFAGALPAAAYLLWLTRTDPLYARLADDVLRVQDFRFYAIAHGILVLPGLAVLASRTLTRRYLLPLCWAACVFLFLLTPFRLGGKQPRLIGGVHIPLVLLATVGVDLAGRGLGALVRRRRNSEDRSGRNVRNRRWSEWIAGGVGGGYLLLTATGTAAMLGRHGAFYARRGPDYYHSTSMQGVFFTLAREGHDGQVTLGGSWTGGWAPVLADTRVYHGHWHMTLDQPHKRAERNWFFTARVSPLDRARWLRERGITWIIRCPWEWNGWAVPLDDVPGLRPVYMSPEVTLYRFDGSGNNLAQRREDAKVR